MNIFSQNERKWKASKSRIWQKLAYLEGNPWCRTEEVVKSKRERTKVKKKKQFVELVITMAKVGLFFLWTIWLTVWNSPQNCTIREQEAWRIYLPPYRLHRLMVPSGLIRSPTLSECTSVVQTSFPQLWRKWQESMVYTWSGTLRKIQGAIVAVLRDRH